MAVDSNIRNNFSLHQYPFTSITTNPPSPLSHMRHACGNPYASPSTPGPPGSSCKSAREGRSSHQPYIPLLPIPSWVVFLHPGHRVFITAGRVRCRIAHHMHGPAPVPSPTLISVLCHIPLRPVTSWGGGYGRRSFLPLGSPLPYLSSPRIRGREI